VFKRQKKLKEMIKNDLASRYHSKKYFKQELSFKKMNAWKIENSMIKEIN